MTPGDETATVAALTGVELERLRRGVRILALYRLDSRDSVEDVVQETVLRTLAALEKGQVRNADHIAAFARGVALHVCAELVRARGRVVPLDGAGVIEQPAAGPDALDALVSSEQRQRLATSLLSLSAADRDLLRLSFQEGLTSSEIARRLGVAPERVRKRKERALERLRRLFQRSRSKVSRADGDIHFVEGDRD